MGRADKSPLQNSKQFMWTLSLEEMYIVTFFQRVEFGKWVRSDFTVERAEKQLPSGTAAR